MNENSRAMLIRDFISIRRDLDSVGVSSEEIALATGLSLKELRDFTEGKYEIRPD